MRLDARIVQFCEMKPQKKSGMPEERINIALPPSVWGPIFWNTIHIATLGYPGNPSEEDKIGMTKFFESLTTVIPCPICREHYKTHLQEMPIQAVLDSRGNLIKWGWELHNRVNEMLDKRKYTMDEFVDHIKKLGSPNQSNYTQLCTGIATGTAIGIIGYYVYQKYVR